MPRSTFILASVLVAALVCGLAHAGIAGRVQSVAAERVVLGVHLGDTPVRIVVQAGKMATMTTLGWPLIGVVANPRGSTLEVVISSAAPQTGAVARGEMREVYRTTIEQAGSVRLDVAGGALVVEWIETKAPIVSDLPAGGCTSCCLTCGESTACACYVEMSCGFCCCSGVCACDIEGLTGQGRGTRTCGAGRSPQARNSASVLSTTKK